MANSTYKWSRDKRRKTYIPPLLSDQDEFVPDTHIPLYKLVTNPNDPAIYMADAVAQKFRHETFDAVHRLYQKYGSPDFQVFWNYNLDAINEIGLNKFGTHTRLLPIIGLMECFEKKMALKSNGRMRYIISFGINREHLTEYLKAVKLAKKTGEEVPLPKLELRERKSRDLILFGETYIRAGGGRLHIDKNAVYNKFSHWCSLNGVSKKTGATMALKYFIDNHPIDGLKNLEEYDIFTELDQPLFAAKKKDDSVDETIKVKVDGGVIDKSKSIIKLYNRDVANIDKETMTINGYVNNALHLLNQNMPLKYRDRELYEQQRQLELMQAESGAKLEDEETDGFDFDYEDDEDDEK